MPSCAQQGRAGRGRGGLVGAERPPVSRNVGKTQSPWPDCRANFLWPTRRMRDAAWHGLQKESTVTANECHCEHEATCALYGGQAMDAIATKPVQGRGTPLCEVGGNGYGMGGGRLAGVWQLLRAMKRQNQIALQLIAHWVGQGGGSRLQ